MRVAFLGLGRRSQGFIDGLRATEGVEVVAGADTWEAARQRFAHKCPGARTYASPEELFIAHDDLDLALIFSRDCDHEAFALEALSHGAEVFTEKPMATSAAACRRMIAAAEANGKRLMVGFNLRFHPTAVEAKRFVDSGILGKLYALCEWHEVDLNYFHNWMSVRANSGGLLFQKGSHDFDLFNWLAGAEPEAMAGFGGLQRYGGDRANDLHCPDCDDRETCVEVVRDAQLYFPISDAEGVANLEQTKCAFRQEIDVCDHHVLSFRYTNGVHASYTEIHGSPVSQRRFVLFGENGRFEFEIQTHTLSWRSRDGKDTNSWTAPKQTGGHGGADSPLLAALVAAFRDGAEIPVTAGDGLNAVRLAEAGELAIQTGQVVSLADL